jgi:hypothetical protein
VDGHADPARRNKVVPVFARPDLAPTGDATDSGDAAQGRAVDAAVVGAAATALFEVVLQIVGGVEVSEWAPSWNKRGAEREREGGGGNTHQDVDTLVAVSEGTSRIRRRTAGIVFAACANADAVGRVRRRWWRRRFLTREVVRLLVVGGDEAVCARALRIKGAVASLLSDKLAALVHSVGSSAAKVCSSLAHEIRNALGSSKDGERYTHWKRRADCTDR